MAYDVCEPCRDCHNTHCVTLCPCNGFYQDQSILYIDADACIDCEACVPECTVEAIFHENSLPVQWLHFVALNAERIAALKPKGGNITEKQEPREGPGCVRR